VERFLRSLDHCRFATIDRSGYPYCVPVGYLYERPHIYIPKNSKTKKVKNLSLNPKSCIIVDVYEKRNRQSSHDARSAHVAIGCDVLSATKVESFQLFLRFRLHLSPSGPFCWKHASLREAPAFKVGFTPISSFASLGASLPPILCVSLTHRLSASTQVKGSSEHPHFKGI